MNSKLTFNNNQKSGPWLEVIFQIASEQKNGMWEYDEDENVIAFLIEGYESNLYFSIKEISESEMIVIEKLYKTESDAFFNYITMKKE